MAVNLLHIKNPVAAGFPSPAMDYMEERIDLTKEFVAHPLSTYLFETSGDSMINAFIAPSKTKLLVDKSLTAQNGDIVIAVVNGEFTVKWLKKNDYKGFLVPGNRHYPEIEITDDMNLQIWGVVTRIFIDPKEIRKCMP